MQRRIEVGPVLVALGALLLLVSLFLDWYDPGLTAWTAFEIVDLGLAVLGIAAAAGAIGLLVPSATLVERRWLPPLVIAAIVLAVFALLDPPPAAANAAPETGAWLALASAVVMGAGALLTFGRVSFAVTVEGRDPRRRVAAYDARGGERPPSTAPFNPFEEEEEEAPSRATEAFRARAPLSSRRSGWRSLGREAADPAGDGEDRPDEPAVRPGTSAGAARPGASGGTPPVPSAPVPPGASAAGREAPPPASAAGREAPPAVPQRERDAPPAAPGREPDAPPPGDEAELPRAEGRRRRGSWLEPESGEPEEPPAGSRRAEEPGSN
jgi:hypothetical protein